MAKKLLLNNIIGGDVPPTEQPTATLITDQLFCHLDARDIHRKTWNDRTGKYTFTNSSFLSASNRFYLYNKTAKCSTLKLNSFPFTLEFTVTITSVQSDGILFSRSNTPDDFKICCRDNNYFGIYSTNMQPNSLDNCLSITEVKGGELHIIDFVFVSNTELIVYLDGVIQTQNTSITLSDSILTLAGYQLGGTTGVVSIVGDLYSFRCYQKALSQYETRCNCLYEAKQNRTKTSAETQTNNYKNKW